MCRPSCGATRCAGTIADLENEIKHRDRRILELKREVDEAQTLIAEMREQVQDCNDMIDRWVEAFEMTLSDNGTYSPAPWIAKMESYLDKYNALADQWNKFIPKTRDNALKVQSFPRAASCFAWTGSSRFSSS